MTGALAYLTLALHREPLRVAAAAAARAPLPGRRARRRPVCLCRVLPTSRWPFVGRVDRPHRRCSCVIRGWSRSPARSCSCSSRRSRGCCPRRANPPWRFRGRRAMAVSRADDAASSGALSRAPIADRIDDRQRAHDGVLPAVESSSTGWTFFAGVFLIMTTMNLHFTGVSLRRREPRGARRGRSGASMAANRARRSARSASSRRPSLATGRRSPASGSASRHRG